MTISHQDTERFWSKVDVLGEDDCWMWKASTGSGYGVFRINSRQRCATRVAYEIATGVHPGKMDVCHSCDVRCKPGDSSYRRCVNPRHLWLGTRLDNQRDMVAKGRSATGEKNGQSKLTAGLVRRIRELRASGMSHARIAVEVAVPRRTVSHVIVGDTWKCVEASP